MNTQNIEVNTIAEDDIDEQETILIEEAVIIIEDNMEAVQLVETGDDEMATTIEIIEGVDEEIVMPLTAEGDNKIAEDKQKQSNEKQSEAWFLRWN